MSKSDRRTSLVAAAPRVRAAALVAILMVTVLGCAPTATRGTPPPPGPDGQLDLAAAPDFIEVAIDRPGMRGYVTRADYARLDPSGIGVNVVGDDLRTVIGSLIPGKGFIPVGADPALVSLIPAVEGMSTPPGGTNDIPVYVWNRSSLPVTVHAPGTAVTISFDPAQPGVGCLPGNATSILVEQAGAAAPTSVPIWDGPFGVEVSPAGDASFSQGRPTWWTDDSNPCKG